jgi:UDP-GlcNAc:undecaprenyl-phosphate GlcNAc-1-phosphate transferase
VTVVVALVAGAVVAAALRRGMAEVLTLEVLQRENHRGHRLPTAVGLVLVAAVVLVDGGRTFAGVVGISDAATAPERLLMLAAVVVFGFLGVVDDLLGDGRDRGLKGHIAAALRGRVTTGFVKLAAGAAAALVLAGAAVGDRPGRVLVDGALIALAANLANLFDRAPGRTTKVALLAYVPVAVAAGTAAVGVALAVVVGAAVALLVGDLREEHMLGDAGAGGAHRHGRRHPRPDPPVGGGLLQSHHRGDAAPAAARPPRPPPGHGGRRARAGAERRSRRPPRPGRRR